MAINMNQISQIAAILVYLTLVVCPWHASAQAAAIDLSGYDPACGVAVQSDRDRLTVRWPLENGEIGQFVLDLHRANRFSRTLPSRRRLASRSARCYRALIPWPSWSLANAGRRHSGRRR